MPDPLTVTAASLLAAKALEAFSGEAGKSAWAAVERVGELVRAKFEGDKPAKETLAAVEALPTDSVHVETLAEVLRIRAEHDQAFRNALTNLVAEAKAAGAVQIAVQVISGGNIGFVAGRDVHIDSLNLPPIPEEKPSKGQILYPESGQRLPRTFTVEGTLSDIPPGHHIWVAVQIGNLLWPKEPEIPSKDHHWSQQIVEGGSPPGGWLSLALLMVDATGNQMIEGWIRRGRSTGDWPGLNNIPGRKLHVVRNLGLE